MTTADPKNLESKLQTPTQSTGDDPDDTKNPEPTKEVGPSKTGHLSDAHMSIDKPTHNLEDQGAPPELPPPPAYQPRDMNKNMVPHIENVYPSEQEGFALLEDDNRKWHDSPGNGSDLVGQSSGDDFSDEDDLGAEDDELEDDQYFEDEFSDDIQEMDDLTRPKDTFVYDTHGPYLPHQHAGHVRKLNPSHIQRKRPLLLKTTSDIRLETTNSIPASVDPSTATEEQQFLLGCNEVTRQMHQGDIAQVFQGIKTAMDQAIERRKDEATLNAQGYTPTQLRIFESMYFGVWAKLLLERRLGPHPGPIIDFLREFIELACLIIQQDNDLPETYAQALAMMFEPGDLEIYRRPKRPARLSHERVARFSDYSEYGLDDDELSPLQQEFQGLFVTVGGMEACLGAIESQVEDPERNDSKLKTVLLLLTLVSRSQLLARESDQSSIAGDDFTKRLTAAILGYFPDHLDGFKSVNKSVILNIISLVGQFLIENHRSPILSPGFHHETEFDYDFEQDPISRSNVSEIKYSDFRLEMAVRLMKTTRLDLRLAGLIELKEVLVRIQRLQQNRSRLRRRSDSDMDVVEADKKPIEHLCSRLQSMQIVGHIFGSNIHLEIVQRSTDVLVFLVQTKVFTLGDLDLIWASVGGNQHRSIVYGVYQVLSDLSSKLPQEYLRHLFTKLQTAPLENWDQQLVDLSRSMFLSMVQRAKYNPEEGTMSLIPFQTLLNVLRAATPSYSRDDPNVAPAAVNPDVLANIVSLLSEGIRVGPLPQDRKVLVDCCIQDLKTNHPGAFWGLQVIQQIFEQHFTNTDNTALQFYKQACSSLPNLFMADLKVYANAMKKQPPTPSPTVCSFVSLTAHLNLQEYFKNMQLRNRLIFLKAMARIFPAFWSSTDLADTLWTCLIADPIGAQEQDEAFLCLEGINDLKFAEYVYQTLLPGLDVARITEKGWGCLRQYFLLINWHRRNVSVRNDSPNGSGQVIVVMAPMQGMNLIWKVALHTQSPNVGLQATDFISQLIKSYPEQDDASQSIEAVREFREGLIETCVEHLVASSERLSNIDPMELNEVSLEFERCICILKAFLAACNSEMTDGSFRPEIHGTLDEDVMLTLKINASNSHFQLAAHPSGTLSMLRRSIAAKLGCTDPEDIRIFYHGKDFSVSIDHKTLEELSVESGQTFLASKRPTSSVYRQMSVQKNLPTDLLLKPSFFERIRQILLLDEKYASQAWDIVTRLPTSPVLLQSFQSLNEDVDWNVLLDARSPFLLLYSLQILNSLIKEDQLQDQKWTKRFVELGGQQYLTTLLMSDSGLGSSNTSPTARKALGLMLKVLVRLADSSEIEGESLSMSGLTVPVFINKLVAEILTSAARAGSHSPRWQYFQACPDIRSLIFVSMVKSDSAQIRQIVLEMGRKFCMQSIAAEGTISPVIFFLDILQSFLPLSKEYESNCSELFGFFEAVAREANRYCSEEYFRSLYTKLMETIINHPIAEDSSSLKEDTVLVGMLKVATAMINTDPRLKRLDTDFRIIDYVFDECLFPQMPSLELETSSKPVAAKCQSDASRAAAFEFLEESTRSTLETLCHVVKKTHDHFQREHDMAEFWGYDPQMTKRARCGFVGLQNLGATCYVNSIVQQFFMNRDFRTGILDAPTDENDANRNDTLLYQLQLLFGNLQESMKRSYNAHGFCYAYKDWDGNPMNVAVQMDVDEFFNILFDRLESSVKSTPQEELFKKQYGGKLVQQIKSKDCEHISEREDSFFSIQCEVKNKKSLEESLQLYVQGEILDGDNKYKCSSCDKHVDAIKRACIKELPQNLILHLKRFDYDMDTMRRIKINDRFEFPTRLDMEPYTLDYLTRKEQAQEGGVSSPSTHLPEHSAAFQYNLVGVLVHTGTADSGHYYSYIKDRSLEGTTSDQGAENTLWYHFNDSKVEEFDPSEIPSKAFGGPEYIPSESPYIKSSPRMTTKPYSAYMLFYERADAPVPKVPMVIESKVPSDIKDVVVKENIILMKDLAVFDRLYYRFVWDLFHMYESLPQDDQALVVSDEQPEFLSMRYGLDFFFTVLIHARDVDQELQKWGRFLSSVLSRYPRGCSDFLYRLTQHPVLFSSVLLYCPINQVREAVVDLVFEALHELRKDKDSYGLVHMGDAPADDLEDDLFCVSGSPVFEIIAYLLRLLPDARANWRNFDEYFKLMYNITQLGRAERITMIKMGYVAELVEFYISDEKFDFKKKKMGDKFTKPAFQFLLLTVQELVCTCDAVRSYQLLQEQGQDSVHREASSDSSSSTSSALSSPSSDDYASKDDVPSGAVEPTPVLSKADLSALFFSTGMQATNEHTALTIKKMVADRVDSGIISKIVCHLAAHDYLGTRYLESLANNLDYGHEDRCGVILQVFKDVVQIGDDLLERRVEFILGHVTKFLEMSPHGASAYDCLEFFRTISDYGQCGRFTQAWLLRNTRAWLQELLLVQADAETRARARMFYMELLSSERAFNGWTDEEAASASSEHFASLLQLMGGLPQMVAYFQNQPRGEDDESGWRFVDYFKTLTELVKGDRERDLFSHSWKPFLEVLSRLDSQQLNLDYDKKEMMVFWYRIMNNNVERNTQLAQYKLVGTVLRKFYVCLQNNPVNIQFHREVLPIYFGLVLRFSVLWRPFLQEWVQCHNYTWALGAMKWGAFASHCPQELTHLLEYTLMEFPQYREECWRSVLSPDAARFHCYFTMLARSLFDPGNEISGNLFFRHGGLIHLTDAMRLADQGTVTNENEFYNVEALSLLCDYLTRMHVCHNTPSFAFAMDHWSNIATCIEILLGNLSFNTPGPVYQASIEILQEIVNEARSAQNLPILKALDTAHCRWRDSYEGGLKQSDVQTIFGGPRSPFCQYGAVEAPQVMSGVGFAPVRIGPLIIVHPELLQNMSTLPPALLDDWYLPYWELTRSICKLEGSHKHKAIELAALLAMEQLAVGSLIHFEVLCEAAEQAEKDTDVAMSLQNPYVTMFVERFLNRSQYLDLKEPHLSAGARLIGVVSTYMDKAALEFLSAERLARIEAILEQKNKVVTTTTLAEVDLQHIVTCLQNFKMLGLDKDEKTFEILSHLYDRIRPVVATAPASYSILLSGLLQLTTITHDVDKEISDESGDSTLNEGMSSNDGGAGSIKDLSANTSAEDIVVLSPAGPSTDEDVNMVAAMLGGEVAVEEKIPGKEMEVQTSAVQEKDEELKKAGLKEDEPEFVEV
ncbi:MAG: hypothetical protein BYD32DRAFT_438947 [Podila humilis]|nr:MAG: hypothetical protein BYD32DRAFT_438947 [Podila humilis]